MTIKEAITLKKGDLVIMSNNTKHYKGMIFEVEDFTEHDNWCCRVTLKQPGFDGGFRLYNYDTRRLERFEA